MSLQSSFMHKPSSKSSSSSIASSEGINEDNSTADDQNSKRKFRNLNEKKRRDQFNGLINELYQLVCCDNEEDSFTAGGSHKKVDKSSILRSAITFLKNHSPTALSVKVENEDLNEGLFAKNTQNTTSFKPSFLTDEDYTNFMLEALDAFTLVIEANTKGNIVYASESILSLLGHNPGKFNRFVGYQKIKQEVQQEELSIFDIIHESEKEYLMQLLTASERIDSPYVSMKLHFRQHDANSAREISFEPVDLLGLSFNQQTSSRDYSIPNESNYFIFVAKMQMPKLLKEVHVFSYHHNDNSKTIEFRSRHSLEWKFLFVDHRASLWVGFLPFELLATSFYDYCHWDDLSNVVAGHEQLIVNGEGTSCHYRFLTKGNRWLWLKTRYKIVYNRWNSKAEKIDCIHSVICLDGESKFCSKPLSSLRAERRDQRVETTSARNGRTWLSDATNQKNFKRYPKMRAHRKAGSSCSFVKAADISLKMKSLSSDDIVPQVPSLAQTYFYSPTQTVLNRNESLGLGNELQIHLSAVPTNSSSIHTMAPASGFNLTRSTVLNEPRQVTDQISNLNPMNKQELKNYLYERQRILKQAIENHKKELEQTSEQLRAIEEEEIFKSSDIQNKCSFDQTIAYRSTDNSMQFSPIIQEFGFMSNLTMNQAELSSQLISHHNIVRTE
ncbi:circadian locomoter output cycles protein kaput-like protein [Dinothrombium tinctorium]|uniref:Circadian locomoter output cycles protein kaput-like protein n=1 Tax=Dinothrombium tinctorium TaxID=1965070 RepID=A0A443RIP0_9ACAR|nr:circadian locomoter output cycles protein kaput-like protein [Dinothrombium tinctorium]